VIAIEQLLASALGEASEAEEAIVEEHVLSCSECAARYATFVEIGLALRELVEGVALQMPVTRSLLDRLDAAGLITRRYVLAPGATVPCGVGAHDLYSLVRLEADFTGVSRVDLFYGPQRLPDVPFDASGGAVYTVNPAALLRTLPTMEIPLRLVAVEDGVDRPLGDYTLSHRAS
jgi:hypothetical protein